MAQPIDQLTALPPCHEAVTIVHQDEDLLVVEKPSGLLSVPGRSPMNRDCVISRLTPEFPGASAVHRLDFDTSGLLAVPLNKASLSNLSRQFQARSVKKRYVAVVQGQVPEDTGRVDQPIAPDWERRPRYKISPEGKPAQTDYRVLARNPAEDTTRVALYPITGRSHQLRLHMQTLGHPILGCGFYAPGPVRERSERLLLHAAELSFQHPATAEWLTFESPAPF